MTNALLNQLALISPSSRLITRVATPLPTRLVRARHSLMNLSTPTSRASDCIGMSGMIARLAAEVMKPALVTPAALLDVSIALARMLDRKIFVEGTGGYVSVDLGGRRINK